MSVIQKIANFSWSGQEDGNYLPRSLNNKFFWYNKMFYSHNFKMKRTPFFFWNERKKYLKISKWSRAFAKSAFILSSKKKPHVVARISNSIWFFYVSISRKFLKWRTGEITNHAMLMHCFVTFKVKKCQNRSTLNTMCITRSQIVATTLRNDA